jgi:hypothetical protein
VKNDGRRGGRGGDGGRPRREERSRSATSRHTVRKRDEKKSDKAQSRLSREDRLKERKQRTASKIEVNDKGEHDEDLMPSQWNKKQYVMFFDALKEHGLNFTKIAERIGSNRFIVSQFFKKYSERKNLPCNPMNQPIWSDEERETLVKTLESHGENYDMMLRNIGNKSRRSITQYIRRITDRFNAKEELTEFE